MEIVIQESILRGDGVVLCARRPEGGRLELFVDADDVEAPVVSISMEAVLELDPTLREVFELGEGRHGWRFNEGESFLYVRIPVGPTFMLSIDGVLEGECSGPLVPPAGVRAEIVAWVRAPDLEAAIGFGKSYLRNEGWSVELIACQRCEREQFLESEDQLMMYEQAQTDGEVVSICLDPEDLSPEQIRWLDENQL